ncbi:hypothetical protein CMI37_25065 [Candidatus Pacearchaeota archaeon]|nr:hypothetical protein [Candidatus Pacearchaeota archaeon]|tara:strand:+ start:392 stop:727 length:336 start_codon:yes stop_codon:yes gene_type:complete
MVDATKATESEYLNADTVKELSKKKGVITSAGEYQETEWGDKLTMEIEVDGRQKKWRVNRSSAQNLKAEFGVNTDKWVGKVVNLQVINIQGKQSVLATPVPNQMAGTEDVN